MFPRGISYSNCKNYPVFYGSDITMTIIVAMPTIPILC